MANPPFLNTRLAQHEHLDQAKQIELFDSITRNLEDAYDNFASITNLQEAKKANTSTFLQLAVAAKRKIAFGEGTLTWAANTFATEKEIAHGLGTAAVFAVISAHNANLAYGVTLKNTLIIKVAGHAETAISGTFGFDWLAIG